jgi:small-conductance mechanosensitive channel
VTLLSGRPSRPAQSRGLFMNNIIYIIGLIVVVLAILSFLGLR